MEDETKKCPDCERWQTMARELQNIIRRERHRGIILEAEILVLMEEIPTRPGCVTQPPDQLRGPGRRAKEESSETQKHH